MNSSESAEAIVKMMLEGTEVAVRLTGSGAKELAVMLYTMAKDQKMTKGKTNLNNMLKYGNSIEIFSLKENQLKEFHKEAKRYGVLYTVLSDKKQTNKDGMVDLFIRKEDAPKVNRIVEKCKLSTVALADLKSEVEKDKIDEMLKEAKERGVEVKSVDVKKQEEIENKPLQKEGNEISNPELAKIEKSPLSEPSYENKKNSGVVSKNKKPSVREAIKKIKEEMKVKETKTSNNDKSKTNKIKHHEQPMKKKKKKLNER